MKIRLVIAAAVVTGGLAACSGPAVDSGTTAKANRQIQLAEPAPADRAVVSDLEAHQPVQATTPRRASQVSVAPVERARAPEPVPSATASASVDVAASVPMPEMKMTMSSEAESAQVGGMSRMPVIPLIGSGRVDGMSNGSHGGVEGSFRGPMVLIRGGMGGIDDKCDTRGHHGVGAAVNRSTGGFGGYPRGGIR